MRLKQHTLKTIAAWQENPNRPRGLCKYEPSCSAYAHEAIESYGLTRGFLLSFGRIMRCSPIGRGGHDPVPVRN